MEKNEWGTNQHTKDRMYQNNTSSKNVREIIANQLNIGSATVIRASESLFFLYFIRISYV